MKIQRMFSNVPIRHKFVFWNFARNKHGVKKRAAQTMLSCAGARKWPRLKLPTGAPAPKLLSKTMQQLSLVSSSSPSALSSSLTGRTWQTSLFPEFARNMKGHKRKETTRSIFNLLISEKSAVEMMFGVSCGRTDNSRRRSLSEKF